MEGWDVEAVHAASESALARIRAGEGPVLIWLLLRVTGIPMTEEQSIRSRGDAYRRYQQTTSAFVPWFPRKPSARSDQPSASEVTKLNADR